MRHILVFWLFIFIAGCGHLNKNVYGECPPDPKNTIIFIDACYSSHADYYTPLGKGFCTDKTHAEKVILTYKAAGGQNKVWLFGLYYLNGSRLFTKPLISAIKCGVKAVSISMTGTFVSGIEQKLINKYVARGGKVYAAAGNKAVNLNKSPRYPVSYRNVIGVGAKRCHFKAPYSNYGLDVDAWECGESYNYKDRGTSFATPRYLAKKEG